MSRLVWAVVLVAAIVLVALGVPPAGRAGRAGSPGRRRAAEPAPRALGPTLASRRLVLPELKVKRGAALPTAPLTAAPAIVLRRPAPTRYPIVLAHGYLGLRGEYFVGVRSRLEALGYKVHSARLAPAASVRLRAAQLARQIESLPAERVNIIAHSMGGLDARYAIAQLGLSPRVASLTTLGTPHRGTPIADASALWIGEWRHLRRMLDAFGANVDGLYDLTTARMEEFNRLVGDAADVVYSSVVGAVTPEVRPHNALLAPGFAYLHRTVGLNDGLVPAESQRWGQVVGEVEADHWEQIGWSRRFDAQAFYAILAEHLAEWGL